MYTRNLTSIIKSMNDEDYESFVSNVHDYHINQLNTKIKKSVIERTINKFKSGETIKIGFSYLDSYLYALNQMENYDLQNVLLHGKKSNKPITWRQALLNITNDLPLPRNMKSEHLDVVNTKLLRSIFQQILVICSSASKNETGRRLKVIEDFLKLTSRIS